MKNAAKNKRLEGLDLARYLAFVGMVIVNFKIAMGAESDTGNWLADLTALLEGRAAATFVVLAGFGLGLAAASSSYFDNFTTTIKRALFLLVIGLLNTLIFDADILHYYAFYFLFGILFINCSNRNLIWSILLINLAFIFMILVLDYDKGWNWNDYTYQGFWTMEGFVRNLFFNGWHPVVPWISFLLLGIFLSRYDYSNKSGQNRLIAMGLMLVIIVQSITYFITHYVDDPDLKILFGTAPIPPTPLYIAAGSGVAMAVIGLCLMVAPWLKKTGILSMIAPAGRQTLTLYIAHILIGMGTLEALNMLGGQSIGTAVIASLLFCLFATIYAWLWARWFRRGPIEWLMRKLAG